MALFAAILALALGAAPRPPSALDKCTATPTDHGFQYECADLVARVDDEPEIGDAAAKDVAGRLQGASAVMGSGAKRRTEKRLLGAGEVEIVVTEAPGRPDAMFLAPIPYKAGTRIVSCHGGTRRCAAVMSGLAGMPWGSATPARGAVLKEAGPLAIGGHPVQAPKGCQGTSEPRGGRVMCSKTDWVVWVSADEGTARQLLATNGETMRKALDKPGWKTTESQVPCRLAGAEATCTRLAGEVGGEAFVVLLAVAPVGQSYQYASCMTRGRRIGSPCTLVLETP